MKEPVYRGVIAFGKGMFRLYDVDPEITGDEVIPTEGAAILAVTHFGYFEFALTEWVAWRHARRFVRFMVTTAAFRHRLAGPLLRAMRHIPVQRGAGADGYTRALASLAEGEIVCLFPEASVSPSFTVKACKTGAFRLAAATGAPLIPIAIWGSHRLITRGHPGWSKQALKASFGRSAFAGRHAPVRIRVGEPLAVSADEDVIAGTARLRARLVELVTEAQQDYPMPADPSKHWWVPAHLGGAAPDPASIPASASVRMDEPHHTR